MQTLTLKKVIKANRKALQDGTLGAERYSGGSCLYEYPDGAKCAIGQCLTAPTIQKVQNKFLNEVTVDTLESNKVIKLGGNKQQKALIYALQRFHDTWATGSRLSLPPGTTKYRHVPDEFRTLLRVTDGVVLKDLFETALNLAEKYA